MQQAGFDFTIPESQSTSAGQNSRGGSRAHEGFQFLRGGSSGDASEFHLAAARKLSREIRRADRHSPEATRTGRLVCRHLVAMLQEHA